MSKLQADVENHTKRPIRSWITVRLAENWIRMSFGQTEIFSIMKERHRTDHLSVACGSSHGIWKDGAEQKNLEWKSSVGELEAEVVTGIQAEKGETVVLEKMICYTTSLDLGKRRTEVFCAGRT